MKTTTHINKHHFSGRNLRYCKITIANIFSPCAKPWYVKIDVARFSQSSRRLENEPFFAGLRTIRFHSRSATPAGRDGYDSRPLAGEL
jgi:hypothetical protein